MNRGSEKKDKNASLTIVYASSALYFFIKNKQLDKIKLF